MQKCLKFSLSLSRVFNKWIARTSCLHMYFDLVVFRMSDYARMSNFWSHFLIDRLLVNQSNCTIAPCLVHEQSLVKCLGLTGGDSFSPHPLPLLAHPLLTSPQFFTHPSLACLIARLFDLSAWKRKGNGCYAVYCPLGNSPCLRQPDDTIHEP